MDGPRDYHTKQGNSDRERQILYITYMCNLKSSADEFIYKTETDTQKYEISKVGNEDAGGG